MLSIFCILHALNKFFEMKKVSTCLHHIFKKILVNTKFDERWSLSFILSSHEYSSVSIHAESKCLLYKIKYTWWRYSLEKKQTFIDKVCLS